MKNFENIAQLLEEANLRSAAVVLRQELKQGKARIKKQQDLMGRSSRSNQSDILQKPPVNVKCQVKSNDVMEQFINKMINKKKAIPEKVNDKIKKIQNTPVFQNLIKKQSIKRTSSISQQEQKIEKQSIGQQDVQVEKQKIFEQEKSEDSFELPHFGQTGIISNQRPQVPSPSMMVMVEDELMQAESIETPQSHPMPSMIIKSQEESSFIESHSLLGDLAEVDEYEDDDDPGFYSFAATEDNLNEISAQLAQKYNFPQRACQPKRPEDSRVKEHLK